MTQPNDKISAVDAAQQVRLQHLEKNTEQIKAKLEQHLIECAKANKHLLVAVIGGIVVIVASIFAENLFF